MIKKRVVLNSFRQDLGDKRMSTSGDFNERRQSWNCRKTTSSQSSRPNSFPFKIRGVLIVTIYDAYKLCLKNIRGPTVTVKLMSLLTAHV